MTGHAQVDLGDTSWREVFTQYEAMLRDLKERRTSAALVVSLVNGELDIRGLGLCDTPAAAAALASIATTRLRASQREMLSAYTKLRARSFEDARIAAAMKEAQ